jgi:hypothetical protein
VKASIRQLNKQEETRVMRYVMCLVVLGSLGLLSVPAEGPTERDLTELINRLIELDSIDLAPKVSSCCISDANRGFRCVPR